MNNDEMRRVLLENSEPEEYSDGESTVCRHCHVELSKLHPPAEGEKTEIVRHHIECPMTALRLKHGFEHNPKGLKLFLYSIQDSHTDGNAVGVLAYDRKQADAIAIHKFSGAISQADVAEKEVDVGVCFRSDSYYAPLLTFYQGNA